MLGLGLEVRRIRPDALGQPRRSNFGEQDIINRLLREMPGLRRYAVDIGAGDGITHSNSFDLFAQGFAGCACEGHAQRFARLAYLHRKRQDLALSRLYVTPDNVVDWLRACGAPPDFGLLSLDIDGYDHFVLRRILSTFAPTVLCLEINEKIPPPLRFTVLWRPDYVWDESHCFGQSLSLAHDLASAHGYRLVALEYNNAFFVRLDQAPSWPTLSPEEAYRTGYRERSDRLAKLPWNRDMEALLSLDPEAGAAFLRQRFAGREGYYRLETGPFADA